MSNIFARAKALRKSNPNKTWQQLVKLASTKKVSSPKKNSSMATTKKRAAPKKKRRVSGVTTTKKTVTRRKSVGAIIDANMVQIAGGLALTSVAEGFLAPIKAKIPQNMQKFADPIVAILAYKGSTYFKNPIAKGVCLGLMKSGVDGTVKVITGAMGVQQPSVTPPPPQTPNRQMTMGDIYVPLPTPNIGEIKAFLGATTSSDNPYATMSNMGNVDQAYLPLGWDA